MLTNAEKAHLDEYGFVLLENAITTAQADALRDRSMALAEQERKASGEHVYLDDKAQRVWNLVDKDELFENAIPVSAYAQRDRISARRRLYTQFVHCEHYRTRCAGGRTPH